MIADCIILSLAVGCIAACFAAMRLKDPLWWILLTTSCLLAVISYLRVTDPRESALPAPMPSLYQPAPPRAFVLISNDGK